MVGEVPAELRRLPRFGFELQLNELFNRLWPLSEVSLRESTSNISSRLAW